MRRSPTMDAPHDDAVNVPRRIVAGTLVVIALLIWLVTTVGPELESLLGMSPEQEAVAAVVERAIVAGQTIAVPPARDASGLVPPAVLAQMHDRVRLVAGDLFAEPYRSTWIQTWDEVIDREGSANHVTGGGADDFSRWHVALDGERGTVNVRARIYLEQWQAPGSSPIAHASNVADYQLTVSRSGGAWLITSMDMRFAPGGGP